MYFELLYNFVANISHSTKNSTRYCHNGTYVFIYGTRNSWKIFAKLQLCRKI